MPKPDPVRLVEHDAAWGAAASAEAVRLHEAAGPAIREVHHIGSTAIPGIVAKPILDLLGVAVSLPVFDCRRSSLEALGYVWHGEYGLAGRRYCTLTNPITGTRRIHLHCYGAGDAAIARHLAFRDHLRARPDLALDYQNEKLRCSARHVQGSRAYTDCKSAWIRRVEAEALAEEAARRAGRMGAR